MRTLAAVVLASSTLVIPDTADKLPPIPSVEWDEELIFPSTIFDPCRDIEDCGNYAKKRCLEKQRGKPVHTQLGWPVGIDNSGEFPAPIIYEACVYTCGADERRSAQTYLSFCEEVPPTFNPVITQKR